MAADLDDTPVRVNILLPGGATETGMLPPATGPPGLHPDRPGRDGAADRLAGLAAAMACTTSASWPPSSPGWLRARASG